jgi:TatD DNase family protein
MKTRQVVKDTPLYKQLTEMADAHCHLDLIKDANLIKEAIAEGVITIMTNGVDTKSNMKSMELADNRHIFALLGIDPEHSNVTDEELEFNIKLIKQNAKKISGIGEIGLDYGRVKDVISVERQKKVFESFLDLAKQLRMPVSIHSRNALNDVLEILSEKDMGMVHIHFFEGNVQEAKEIEKRGYMISVPPIQSNKRSKVIKEIAIDNIMVESDAPAVGVSPRDVSTSIGIVAEAKKLDFKKAANLLAENTKRFFKINNSSNGGTLMRF